jgi:hypothetical protein
MASGSGMMLDLNHSVFSSLPAVPVASAMAYAPMTSHDSAVGMLHSHKSRKISSSSSSSNTDLQLKRAEHYEKNRDEILRKRREYYQRTRDERIRKQSEYYNSNRDRYVRRCTVLNEQSDGIRPLSG